MTAKVVSLSDFRLPKDMLPHPNGGSAFIRGQLVIKPHPGCLVMEIDSLIAALRARRNREIAILYEAGRPHRQS